MLINEYINDLFMESMKCPAEKVSASFDHFCLNNPNCFVISVDTAFDISSSEVVITIVYKQGETL